MRTARTARKNRTATTVTALTATFVVVAGALAGTSAQAEPKVTVKDVKAAFHEVEAISEDVNQISVRIKGTQDEIDDLDDEIAAQQSQYEDQREQLSAAIVQQQMDQPLGPTVNLLGSEDPEEFLDGLGAVQALNSTRTEALESFGKVARELSNRRAQLKDRKADLLRDKKDTASRQKAMKAKYAKAKADLAELTAAQQASFDSGSTNLDFEVDASGRAKKAIDFALAQLGEPYVWGGVGPNGWDCSGLTMKAWAAAGVTLPRVVGPQYGAVRHISMSELQPGDLVFYASMAHIGMYIGNGRVVHAPRPGRSVEITGLSGFSKAGRVG